ncbi:translocon-associated protein subunit delta [Elysia marginata]|uniref:Translocon-associated protein subunit delta n=1 Tax=Elysia marginata TaxID=1093978 RepID=A0AAV4FL52_9GAST|nr:translocon-associated protein subunit delta [Elysia marginata]
MTAIFKALLTAFLVLLPVSISGDTCLAPQVTSQTYTTPEAVVSFDTVLIVEFSLACKNNLKNINLYADVAGRTLPATKTGEPNKYQGIWSGPLIQSEFVAAMTAIIVWWMAYTQRGKLLA